MNIGLVLSGGVGKGAYHAGFLKALNEEIRCTPNQVTSISCASIGMFGGYAYAANKLDLLYDIWSQIHFDSVADVMYNVWFKHLLRDIIKTLVCEGDNLRIPMYAPICYLPFLHMDYCRLLGSYNKKWRSFILGAASYPFVSGGIHFFRGQLVIDGGIMDNIPVVPLLHHEKPDVIMVLHFVAGYKPRKSHTLYGIPIIDYDISLNSIHRKHSFDFHGDVLNARIQDGYEYGQYICSKLFNNGQNSLEELCAAAKIQKEREVFQRMDNVTFETWGQRLNEVFYPFISKTNVHIRDLYKNKPEQAAQTKEELYADEAMS